MYRFAFGLVTLGIAALLLGSPSARAQSDEYVPEELIDVDIVEHLEAQVPLDLTFVDENEQEVQLGDYFKEDKPVLLTLIYFNCPMLCSLVLNGMVDSLQEVDLKPGEQYELVTVSFNPEEGPALAKLKKQNYIKDFGVAGASQSWHFLTGEEPQIKALTETIGFKYQWNEERQEFAHAAAIFVITPEGKVSRYLYGVAFEPQDVRLALLEASEGRIGNTVDRILLYCYQYDPESGSYAPVAMNIMRLGGVAVIIVLAIILVPLWLRDLRRKQHKSAEEEGTGP
ncbi:MAG TPA: SCO family protein [Firmicutes bacterium]|nr:SCO family protein [Bacillota bacterium]